MRRRVDLQATIDECEHALEVFKAQQMQLLDGSLLEGPAQQFIDLIVVGELQESVAQRQHNLVAWSSMRSGLPTPAREVISA